MARKEAVLSSKIKLWLLIRKRKLSGKKNAVVTSRHENFKVTNSAIKDTVTRVIIYVKPNSSI